MVFVLIAFNIILSLFAFFESLHIFFDVKIVKPVSDFIFKRLFRGKIKTNFLIIIAVIMIVAISMSITENLWKDKYWVSVNSTVVNSQPKQVKVKTYDENNEIEYETKTEYVIKYEFDYEAETYQVSHRSSSDIDVGKTEVIQINPKDPSDKSVAVSSIPLFFLVASGLVFALKVVVMFFKSFISDFIPLPLLKGRCRKKKSVTDETDRRALEKAREAEQIRKDFD